MGAQRRGLPVIAIVSKAHCEQAKAAHSSGKKLIDCADLIIDNQCPPGDCVVELEGLEWRTGPISTITGSDDHQHDSLRDGGSAAGARMSNRLCCPAISLWATPVPRLNWKHSTKPTARA